MKPLFFLAILFTAFASKAQTPVSGGIYTNTTWTKANSPYLVSGTVVAFDSVTLTMEPGTKVVFDNNAELEIRGKLFALGTPADSIQFTGKVQQMGSWKGITLISGRPQDTATKLKAAYCLFAFAKELFDDAGHACPYSFKHCFFFKDSLVGDMRGYGPVTFDSCRFENNYSGPTGWDPNVVVTNCLFINNVQGVSGCKVDKCVFVGNSDYGAFLYHAITNCTFYSNNRGIFADFHNNTKVQHCDIHNNNIGIDIDRIFIDPTISLKNNKICHNKKWNINYYGIHDGDISYNCWCLKDSLSIRATIYDGYSNPSYGLLKFKTFDTCSIIPLISCDTPKNLKAAASGTSDRLISWDSIAGVWGYEYSKDTILYYGTFTTTNSALVTSLPQGIKYNMYVRTRCSATSYSAWVKILDSTEVTEIPAITIANDLIKLYPNPSTNTVNVELTSNAEIALSIYNLMGKVVYTGTISKAVTTIDIAQWPVGMYLLKYQALNDSGIIKFVKQ